MTPLWILQTDRAAASVTLSEDLLVLQNRYIRRVIDRRTGVTVSVTDGDGTEALAAPLREGEVSVDGVTYALEGPCRVILREGDVTEKKFDYVPKPYNTHPYPYPVPGKAVDLVYDRGETEITLTYEIFDDMPVIRKSLHLKNRSDRAVVVDRAETEALSLNETGKLRYYLETDYTGSNGEGYRWNTSIFRDGNTVSVRFDMGPDYDLPAGESFRGMQVYELYCQTICFDHRMNEVQNMYRRVAPWVCEAPLFIHLISDDSQTLRRTADMASDVGFDMIIQSFGSGINVESEDEAYISRVKADYDYVHEKGLTIGGYTLAIIRDYQPMNHDCAINGDHNHIARCLCTKWSEGYWNRILSFMKKTGTDFIEIDGPYHFYTCTGNREGQTEHLHKGLADSRYTQWLKSTVETTALMKELGVYINAPDWLFLSGTNKVAVGYEEIAFSQPRLTQLLMNRIYAYKGTYHKTPSMGWGFLPVEEYHGGGAAAKFEPLTENLAEYDWALALAAASGVWPCVRGKRLYDSEICRGVVKYWTDVMRRHKTLLNSNTVHAYPPKATEDLNFAADMDVILQENHTTPDKMFLMVCNQTAETRTKTFLLPVFYTGLTDLERPHTAPATGNFDAVEIPSFGSWPPVYPQNLENCLEEVAPAADSGSRMSLYERDLPENRTVVAIDRNGNISLTVTLPPMSYTYYVGYAADDGPADPIAIPAGKPFGCKAPEAEVLVADEIRKIDFEAVKKADSVRDVVRAMGMGKEPFNGNRVVLHKNAYARIHDLLYEYNPGNAVNIMFALADVGFHTTLDAGVGEEDIWLLDGWRR